MVRFGEPNIGVSKQQLFEACLRLLQKNSSWHIEDIAISIRREAEENCLLLRNIEFDHHKIYNFILKDYSVNVSKI